MDFPAKKDQSMLSFCCFNDSICLYLLNQQLILALNGLTH